ncbi:MAG: hypothetical protein P1V35_04930 [Planctomycetota bacterium]|nr:hypothetical protein [Planctomycetota bacterium]
MNQIALCLGALLPLTFDLTPGPIQSDAVPSQEVNLQFLPTAGERIEHNWLGTHKLLATEVNSRVAGQDAVSLSQLPSIETKERRVTSDWIRSVEDGKVQNMHRTWVEANLWGQLDFHVPGQAPLEVVLRSPLSNESTSVVFTHVPEENSYGMYFDQSAMAENVLVGVQKDHGYENLLPGKAVKAGDSWSVETKHLIELLAPTGAMDYRQVQPGGGMLIRTLLMGVAGCTDVVWNPGQLKGHFKCKLQKVVGAGAHSTAHIELDYSFETVQDRSEAARELQMLGESNRGTMVLGNSVQLQGKGMGLLIWNLSSNRAHSFAMTGTESVQMMVQTQALNAPAVTQVMELRGVSEQKYRATVRPLDSLPVSWTANPPVRVEPMLKPGKGITPNK